MKIERKQIETFEDITFMVDDFYGKIRKNPLLKDIFNEVIQDRWPEHLDKMYRFWQTVLLGEHTYNGAPFIPHAYLPVEKEHFDTWVGLFNETVDTYFWGELAEKAKWQGSRMAEMFLNKIRYFNNSQSIPLM
ncbi:MAG TPA: group III truncated hemoglobin [Chitinophagaceae bacterium]|nr:group III truncated hemoglobin [Chitinophagaceae bacterium]